MKIGILTDDYLPALGGSELYAYNLARFLRNQNHSASIFTFAPNATGIERDGIPCVRITWSWNPIRLVSFWIALLRFASQHDVLHVIDSYKMGFYAAIASILTGKPLVTSLEGRGILDLPGERPLFRMAHDMYRWTTLHRAKAIIATCREFERIAKRIAPKGNTVYLPNPVDAEFWHPTPATQEFIQRYGTQKVILSVRRLVPKNGIQYLLQALPAIRQRIPNVRYVAIGKGRLEEHLRKMTKELGIENIVDFVGALPNEQIPPYISRADVVVFPSSAEATSLACTEVMAMGKPVVASAIGGYPEMIENDVNGLLVKLFDREDSDYDAPLELPADRIKLLADAVCRVLEHEGDASRLGNGARTRIEQEFAWTVLGPKIFATYG